jgi:hypothetical protein
LSLTTQRFSLIICNIPHEYTTEITVDYLTKSHNDVYSAKRIISAKTNQPTQFIQKTVENLLCQWRFHWPSSLSHRAINLCCVICLKLSPHQVIAMAANMKQVLNNLHNLRLSIANFESLANSESSAQTVHPGLTGIAEQKGLKFIGVIFLLPLPYCLTVCTYQGILRLYQLLLYILYYLLYFNSVAKLQFHNLKTGSI